MGLYSAKLTAEPFLYPETKIIAERSYKWFFEHDFSINKKDKEEDIEVYESDYEEVPIE